MSKQEQNFFKAENKPGEYVFRLFVSGASPNSLRAIMNMRQICETYIKGKYQLEVIDVYQEKTIAETERIIALPLLIKMVPLPQKRLMGDMSDTHKVLCSLGLS